MLLSTYHVCVAYVDVMGNEGPCSADFSSLTAGTGAVNQIGFSAPAASTGMVGWIPYISLASGTYALAYRVNMTAGGPNSGAVCTFTKIETAINACALANTTYGQSGVNAIVAALTVNTARIWVGTVGTSSTSDYVGNSNARTSVNTKSRQLIQKHVQKLHPARLIPPNLAELLTPINPDSLSALRAIAVVEIDAPDDAPGNVAYFTKGALGILRSVERRQ